MTGVESQENINVSGGNNKETTGVIGNTNINNTSQQNHMHM